jgi:phosphopantothenoylcysteine synthetase/decarboxylase
MIGDPESRVLYVLTCAAAPTPGIGALIAGAQRDGWDVYVIATPAAMAFLDPEALERDFGVPVFSEYRRPDEPKRQPPADAAVLAPGTYNTVNKWAAGIADNYALGTLAELTGLGVPIVLLPSVGPALAGNRVYARSLDELRSAGVRVLDGTADEATDTAGGAFPWESALAALAR